MKISKPVKDVEFEILEYGFNYNKQDEPQIWFKLGFSVDGQLYDPMYHNLSLQDKFFQWSLASLNYMTGVVIESIFDIYGENSKYQLEGRKFKANIVESCKDGKFYYNVQLPNVSKKLGKDELKELDNRLKKTMLEYAGKHGGGKDDFEIAF